MKSFIDNSTETFASKEIDLSNYPNDNHSLAITAIDEAGATKTVSTQVNLVSEDKTPPVFRKEQSRVEKTED